MRERLARFMAGRNGNDQFNMFLLVVDVVLLLLASIFKNSVGSVLYPIVFVLLIYIYFRIFSKNVYRRREENGKYMRLKYKFQAALRLRKERWVQRKDYKFFTCPSCHTSLRVPRHRGKVKIVCRKCGTSFFGKT
jgi:ribosomal protein L37AE/L43A